MPTLALFHCLCLLIGIPGFFWHRFAALRKCCWMIFAAQITVPTLLSITVTIVDPITSVFRLPIIRTCWDRHRSWWFLWRHARLCFPSWIKKMRTPSICLLMKFGKYLASFDHHNFDPTLGISSSGLRFTCFKLWTAFPTPCPIEKETAPDTLSKLHVIRLLFLPELTLTSEGFFCPSWSAISHHKQVYQEWLCLFTYFTVTKYS